MAIKFEIHDIPKPTSEQEVSTEEMSKIAKRVKRSNANLRKKMKRIARTEAEAWKNPRHRG